MARRTKEDALATRHALLDAAERSFQVHGVARTSLAQIAEAAGLTRGAIYWHFKDKADLFNAMMQRVTLPLETGLTRVAEAGDADGDIIASLRAHLLSSLRQVTHDEQTRRVLEIAVLMVEMSGELADARAQHAQSLADGRRHLARTLQRAAEQRRISLPAPPEVLATGLKALLRGLVDQWLLAPGMDLERVGQQCVDAFLVGIGLPPDLPPRDRG